MANLKKLETFHVKGNFDPDYARSLPHTIWSMKKLRNVDVNGFTATFLNDTLPEKCFQLEEIQKFSSPYLSYAEDSEKLLRRLLSVQKLRCQFRESWDPHNKCNQILKLNFLCHLESLNLTYIGSKFHGCAFYFPSTLKKLSLAEFRLPWIEISAIRKLPNLEVLKLLVAAFNGERWDVNDEEFLSLKFLKLCRLNIMQWKASDYSFPCLQRLVVEHCGKLEEIPSIFGNIPTVKTIQVRWCSSTAQTSARQILEEQLEMGNEELEVLC